MSSFDRIFGGREAGTRAAEAKPPITNPLARIPGDRLLIIFACAAIIALGVFVASQPSRSSDANGELQLVIQKYCMGDAGWGEAIDARNSLIENYRGGDATDDDLEIAIANFDCNPESASPLESELGQ